MLKNERRNRRRVKEIVGVFLTTVCVGALSSAGAQEQDDEDVDRIVVVGSSIGVSRDAVESQAIPIQLFDADTLELSGDYSIETFLRNEPAFRAGDNAVRGGSGNNRVFQTLNVRGIGPEYTLTLINGRRFGVNGPANIDIIPFRALERVEVLTAGASSIYGSDAVAGVVNLVTKSESDGAEVWGRYATGPDGYGERGFDVSLGGGGDRFKYFLFGTYQETDQVLRADKGLSNDARPLGGFDGRSGSTNPATIRFNQGSPFLAANGFTDGARLILNTDTITPGNNYNSTADFREFDFERDAFDRDPSGTTLLAGSEIWTILGSAEYSMTEKTTLTFDFLYNEINRTSAQGTLPISATVAADQFWNPFGEQVNITVRPDSAFDLSPFGEPVVDPSTRRPEQDNLFVAAEVKHDFTDSLNFELDGSYLRQQAADAQMRNWPSDTGLNAALARGGATAYNPFCNLCNTTEQRLGVHTEFAFFDKTTLMQFDGRFNISDIRGPTGPIEAVIGGGFRREEFERTPNDADRFGLLTRAASTDISLSRDVAVAFGEVKVPLLQEGSAAGALDLNVAARYEDFSDVGGTFDPLISLRWAPLADQLVIRGSWNTSFRAPFLADVAAVPPNPGEGSLREAGTGNLVEVIVLTGPNPDLEPETARTFSAGFIATPSFLPGLFASLDFWDLRQENLVVAPSPQSVFDGTAPGLVRDPTPEEFAFNPEPGVVTVEARLTNFDQRSIRGLDFRIRQDVELGGDVDLGFDFSGTYLLKFEVDELGEQARDLAGVFSPDFQGLSRFSSVGGVSAAKGPFTGRIQFNYTTGFFDDARGTELATDVDSFFTTDLQLRYDLADPGVDYLRGASLNFGITNLFNEDPDFVPTASDFGNNQDVRGRIIFVSLGTRF